MTSTVHGLSVKCWSVEEWLRSEQPWGELLARSDADPLFLSWDWLTLWWQTFGAARGCTSNLLAFYRQRELVGVAPLYHTRLFRGRVVPTRSMQFIGLSWRDPAPLISEYLDVIANRGQEDLVRDACVQNLLGDDAWTELVIGYSEASEAWAQGLSASSDAGYVRQTDPSVSYQADLSAGFSHYLQRLGQSSRRSLWNLRRRIAEHGEVQVERVDAASIPAAFSDLNQLHRLRWHSPAFSGKRLAFHQALAARLAGRGELAMTRLWVGKRVVSVLYDVRKGTRQYNLKMAFDPNLESRASLGLVHLGYALEDAAGVGVKIYDFLAGSGRKTNYKSHLSQMTRELQAVQMLRGRVLPRLYSWHDRRTAALRAAN